MGLLPLLAPEGFLPESFFLQKPPAPGAGHQEKSLDGAGAVRVFFLYFVALISAFLLYVLIAHFFSPFLFLSFLFENWTLITNIGRD